MNIRRYFGDVIDITVVDAAREAALDIVRLFRRKKPPPVPSWSRGFFIVIGGFTKFNMKDDADPAPPILSKPRWWSNPGLRDPNTIIAIVLADPTAEDLAIIIETYGLDRVRRIKEAMRHELTPTQARILERLWVY